MADLKKWTYTGIGGAEAVVQKQVVDGPVLYLSSVHAPAAAAALQAAGYRVRRDSGDILCRLRRERVRVEDAAGLKKRTRGGPGDLQVAARTLVFIWARGMSLRGEQRASSAARMLVYDCGV